MPKNQRRCAGCRARLMGAAAVLPALIGSWGGPSTAWALPALQPVAAPSLVLAQAQPAEPSSVDELRAAIESIKAKLARQRAGQPQAAPPTDLTAQLRDAGERTAELTK